MQLIITIVGFIVLGLFIHTIRNSIMSQITEALAPINEAIARANESINNIQNDVTSLKAKVDAFQPSPDGLSDEDKAALNDIKTSVNALADRAAEIDQLTPPDAPADEPATDGGSL